VLRFVRYIARQRGRSRGWGSASAADIAGAEAGVFLGAGHVEGDLASRNRLLKQPLQEWPAPTAAGAGTETVCKLADALWPLNPQEAHHLPLGDVEAEAQFVVEVHGAGGLGMGGP